MTRIRPPVIAVVLALLAFSSVEAPSTVVKLAHGRTGLSTAGLELDLSSGVKIDLVSYYNSIPPTGYLPMKVMIRNDSGRRRTWRFEFTTQSGYVGRVTSSTIRDFTVDQGDERAFEVLVPTQAVFRNHVAYGNLQLNVKVRGHGVLKGDCFQSSYDGWGSNQTPYLGMGNELAVRSWGLMEEEGRKRSQFLRGTSVDVDLLPSDWRGYLGIECLWLSDSEWRRLGPEVRSAMLDWVSQGGLLTIFEQSTPPDGLRSLGFETDGVYLKHGYGTVLLDVWDGKELKPQEALDTLKAVTNTLPLQAAHGYSKPWALLDLVGETTINTFFYLTFVIGFALLVGPANLFLFARGNNRHRLFWTTPLISIAASVLLSTGIVLKDGFGGSGARFAVCRLMPDQKKALMVQEQAFKTGVMLNRRFQPAERFFIMPIDFEKGSATESWDYLQVEDELSGDWFRSRSTQTHLLEAVRPTRWRVERIASSEGEPPQLLSTIGTTLSDLYYFDEQSVIWKASEVRAGERVRLTPATREAFDRWWESLAAQAGARTRFAMEAERGKPGIFYAAAHEPSGVLLETSPDIKWEKNTVVFTGPCPVVEIREGS